MNAKQTAIQELKDMIDRYNKMLADCTDKSEEDDIIDIVENIEWVVKEIRDLNTPVVAVRESKSFPIKTLSDGAKYKQ